jgi:small subunit ribosomal protein S20
VAHSLSANKRIRQNAKRRVRNRLRKKNVRLNIRKVDELLVKKDAAAAATAIKEAQKVLDRMGVKKILHPNTVARRKSRMARRLNAVVKAAAAG